MDCCQVGVLKESHEVGFSCLLKSQHSARLETQVSFEVLGNFTNQPLERQLPDQQLSGLLVLADLTQGHSSGSVSAGVSDKVSGHEQGGSFLKLV